VSVRRPAPAARLPSRTPPERQHSAGGLVVHQDRVLLIATAGGRRWQIPKGHVEPGERLEQAAVREVREETGVTSRIVAVLPAVDYTFVGKDGRRVRKHVDYYLLDYVSGDAADFDREEADAAAWFSWDEAIDRLSHVNERRVAEKARILTQTTTQEEEPA
jgi:8-oxo-dGTP pyrophosphatase MutT (NUDIX family)